MSASTSGLRADEGSESTARTARVSELWREAKGLVGVIVEWAIRSKPLPISYQVSALAAIGHSPDLYSDRGPPTICLTPEASSATPREHDPLKRHPHPQAIPAKDSQTSTFTSRGNPGPIGASRWHGIGPGILNLVTP